MVRAAAGGGRALTVVPASAATGWRYWLLARRDGVWRLRSVSHRRFAWLPGEAMVASCVGSGHPAPDPGCACGVYGAADLAALQAHGLCLPFAGVAVGEVALWGRLVVDADAYRAERGYPTSLSVVRGTLDEPAVEEATASLGDYGVAVGAVGLTEGLGEISATIRANLTMSR